MNIQFSYMRTNCSLGCKKKYIILFTNISSLSLFIMFYASPHHSHTLSLPLMVTLASLYLSQDFGWLFRVASDQFGWVGFELTLGGQLQVGLGSGGFQVVGCRWAWGRGGCGLWMYGFGFWQVMRWWSLLCVVVDCSGGFNNGGCCVFCGWWLCIVVLIWFLFLFFVFCFFYILFGFVGMDLAMVVVDVDGGGVVEFQVVVGYVGGGCCAVVWLGLIQFSLVQIYFFLLQD